MTSSSTPRDSAGPSSIERGTLFVVAAPSGAGKSSMVNAVLAREPGIALSISYTSRAPRPGERHAHHYHFVDKAEFERMIAAGDFFEYALVHGDYKGTARQSVEPQLAAGKDVLLEIDWQGARQVREKIPDAVSVFILPPSTDTLETRMRNRGQDSEAVIAQRLAAAQEEMSHASEFDYWIVNEHFDTAANELRSIFIAHRLRREAQGRRHAGLFAGLMAGYEP
ncbi:guanylate kinase [Silanimonas sp.]|jgi:guanylate kinase|uniref:guanylate kinase n=1 Tax=Silanimonas sp. TaxID=1929290 RepID=UPI0022CCBC60|nr:guanylate kinase [Silanimonas sp.]MCZ8114264.1 guanylate kinase [Silanimonas sp.]